MKRAGLAVLLVLLASVAAQATTCAGIAGSVLGGYCVPFQALVDPVTGAALGTAANPLVTATAPSATAMGGLTVFRVSSPAGASGISIKTAPGRIYAFDLCNAAPATRYVRFYDATAPVPGSTPVFAGAIAISASTCQQFNSNVGLSFPTGIGLGITAAPADNDTSAVSAGDVTGFLGFQ